MREGREGGREGEGGEREREREGGGRERGGGEALTEGDGERLGRTEEGRGWFWRRRRKGGRWVEKYA